MITILPCVTCTHSILFLLLLLLLLLLLILASMSIVFTSVYQILIGRKQKELKVGSMQLLHEKGKQ